MTRARRALLADALVVLGGGALLASAYAHWVARGDGSGLRGHALVDAVIAVGRHFPGMSAARLTVVWYLVPASGALSWIAAGRFGAGSRAARATAVVALVAAAGATLAFGLLVGFSALGAGVWLAAAGAACLLAGSWIVAPARAVPVAGAAAPERAV